MILDATTKTLEIDLTSAVATSQLSVVTTYVDYTSSSVTSGCNNVQTNNTTATTIVGAPGDGTTYRIVKSITVYNADTVFAEVTIQLNNNSTLATIFKCVIFPNECLKWTDKSGWSVVNASGANKWYGSVLREPMPFWNMGKDTVNTTTVTAVASGTCYACYLGVAPYMSSTAAVYANITTAGVTITWAEIAIAKGDPPLNGNATLTTLGYRDVSTIYNAVGLKTTIINLSTAIQPGDDIWIVFGSNATTPFQMRGGIVDNVQSGVFQTVNSQPSVTPTLSCTLAGAAVVPPWIGVIIY